jgi:hypothetical protein
MLMTRLEFNAGAIEFYKALSVSSMITENSEQCVMSFGGWFVECRDGADWCVTSLVHPPIIRRRKHNMMSGTQDSNGEEDVFTEDHDLIEESTLREDHEEDSTTVQSYDEGWIEWNFSVVYSETWGAPILYFQAQSTDGTKLMRNQVLHELGWDLESMDHWQFLSEEEHPITGNPAYFLHPCQISECLVEMIEMEVDASNSENVESTLQQSFHSLSKGQVLLCWLALMLSSLNIKINSHRYSELQKIIKNGKDKGYI